MIRIEIGRNTTIRKLDKLLELFHASNKDEVDLVLARNTGPSFFVSHGIAALIATIGLRAKRLTVRDWHSSWSHEEISRYFQATLAGQISARFAASITNQRNKEIPLSLDSLRMHTDEAGGILENLIRVRRAALASPEIISPLGKSINIVAHDGPNRATPNVLAGLMNRREAFIKTILFLKQKYLAAGNTPRFSDQREKEAEIDIASFIFEAFQNSFEHGCYDAEGGIIPGVRSISLRKHVARSPIEFERRAEGFPELKEYIDFTISDSSFSKLLEISVSDCGRGLVNHFLNSHSGEIYSKPLEAVSEPRVMQDMILMHLTSKSRSVGAGYGMARIASAVRKLRAFLAIRTGSTWLLYTHGASSEHIFKSRSAPNIEGTHIYLLYPMFSE